MKKLALSLVLLLAGCISDPAPTVHNIVAEDCINKEDSATFNDTTLVTETYLSPCSLSK